jgi:hypothetical protein
MWPCIEPTRSQLPSGLAQTMHVNTSYRSIYLAGAYEKLWLRVIYPQGIGVSGLPATPQCEQKCANIVYVDLSNPDVTLHKYSQSQMHSLTSAFSFLGCSESSA